MQAKLEAVPSSSMTATAFERAREALDKGRKLTAERQKLIKIADRSELGLAGQWWMSTPRTSLWTIAVMRSSWKKLRGWLREKQPNGRSFQSTETSHIGSPLFSQQLSTRLLLRQTLARRYPSGNQAAAIPQPATTVLRVVDGSPPGVTVAAGNTKV